MNNERIIKRLNKYTSKESVNTDSFIKINLTNNEKLLPLNEINHILNVGERFDLERQNSTFYRLIGTIRPLISNVLFNVLGSGDDSWNMFDKKEFKDRTYPSNGLVNDDEDLNYNDSVKFHLKEIDGWFGYFDPDLTKKSFCNFHEMEPKRNRFSFTPDIINNDKKNWELTITYPYSSDTSHFMVNNGLFICDNISVIVNNRSMIALATPCLHNLKVGDIIRLSGTTLDNDYTVVRLGLDDGSLRGYYFVIDTAGTSLTIGSNSRFKKVFAGQESEYYFRLFKKIKTRNNIEIEQDDYEIYNLAFSQNIYNDQIYQFVFNEDIDVSDLTDNLNRPLSELYLTMVKTDSSDTSFSFGSVSSGVECPFISQLNNSKLPSYSYLTNVPVINKIHNGGILPFPSHTPLETNITIANNIFYGDIVEYNKFTLKETILSDVQHRFNTTDRESTTLSTLPAQGARQEGYYYKSHYLIKIREFSSYIEQGDSSTEGIPNYSEDLGDGRFLWRDLLPIGFNDAKEELLNYPFVNGCHYIYQNHCFALKRQDGLNEFLLYYYKYPNDPLGKIMDDNFIIKDPDNDVC